MLTKDEQERLARFLDSHPEFNEAVETLSGRKLGAMTFQERVAAIHEILEAGRGSAALVAAFRAQRDLQNLAADVRGEVGLADQLTLREQEVMQLREKLARTEEQAKRNRADAVSARAEKARAVNSGEPAA